MSSPGAVSIEPCHLANCLPLTRYLFYFIVDFGLFCGLRVLISHLPILLDGTDNYDDGSSGMRPRKNVRRERDDKVHDSIIEERIQRERPCRTLFIRNIKASHLRCAELVCKIH